MKKRIDEAEPETTLRARPLENRPALLIAERVKVLREGRKLILAFQDAGHRFAHISRGKEAQKICLCASAGEQDLLIKILAGADSRLVVGADNALLGSVARTASELLFFSGFTYHPTGIILVKQNKSPFKWRHFEPTIILLCVRWYCRYSLSYRDLEEMMRERGLSVDHTTVWRWVKRYAPVINKRMRPHLKMSGTSYRIDETYVKVGTEWKYLYRAVDSAGDTIEFMLSARRDVSAAKRFFKKLMRADHRRLPFTIGTDKHASYPEAFVTSVREKILPSDCKLRRVKYLNNVIEQDHRFIRRRWRAMQCFRSFHTAERTIEGIEAMHVMRKRQVKRLDGRDSVGQAKFVTSLFGVAA